MATKKSFSENRKSDRSEERPLSKCLSYLNTDKSIGDNTAATLISDLNDSSDVKRSESVLTPNLLNTNQNSAKFENINTVNGSFEISITPQECNSSKSSEEGRLCEFIHISHSNLNRSMEDNAVKICGLDGNNALTRAIHKSQCQPEFNSACAGEETLKPNNAECFLPVRETNLTIFEHISNYFHKKRCLGKLVDYLNNVYRRRLSDIDTLPESNAEPKVDIYEAWILSLEKLTDAISRKLKQFRLDLVHQLANEFLRIRVEEEKKEQEIIEKYKRDIAKLNKIYAEAKSTGQWHFDCDFETFDKNDLLDPNKECKFEKLY